ncbi:patatin-like phospholipase family protein [Maribellus maritimus]|uniref:patatin-like phospholipase family protein n=1 Tax=Maribellus maritimus TaxID=2870838 RepID=UPI001EEB1795|nr:patatin-like phospholipase family protein [Maribellus maritimus]MCG6188116.1 patatin-like phospholipase family protein [Maribellus maritimus]
MTGKFILTFFLIFLLTVESNAQSVGLVLSGGGAKGMAHIGVIRVLEENNIPIDYIAGTSIGAIVGGLYAAGYTPDEMEELFKSDDFYFWSTGKIQEEYRYYFKQPEENPSWFELRITKRDDKVKLLPPTSLIPEEQMDFAFMELLAATNSACENDFDSLMIPFFCVATDVYNHEPVVLREGDMGEAVRASMTVPVYFKPIEINGTLLFDGGIVNNFPHDIMTDLYKPDIIIGHKVASDPKAAAPDDVMEQISNMVMRPTNFKIKPEEGILLETNFTNVNLLDFNKIETAIEAGRNTATVLIDSIKTRVHRRVPQEVVQQKRQEFNAKKPQLFFQNIQVEGIEDPEQRRFIIQSIKHHFNVVSLSLLKKEYFKLVADENVKSIRPIARYNKETGYFDLHLKVEPEKKFKVNIGGNISTKPINQGFASIDYRAFNGRAYNINSNIYFGRFYSSFKLGGRIDFPWRVPFYIAGYSTLNRWDFFASSSELFFEDVRPPYIIQDEYNFRLEAGFPLGLHSKFYAGVAYSNATDEYYQTNIFKKEDDPDQTTFNGLVTQAQIESNSLNYKQYATEGEFGYLSAKYITGKETNLPGTTSNNAFKTIKNHNFYILKAHTTKYFRFGRAFSLGTHAEAVFSNKLLMQNYRSTLLAAPGFYPTPHSKSLFIENFHSNNYLAGGLSTIINFNPSVHLRFEGYGFVPMKEELSNADLTAYQNTNTFENYYLQGMAALVYQTGIGPVSVALNYYEKENTNFYLTLNFGYVLFNKRGF